MKMVAWEIRDQRGRHVDTLYYCEGCDEQYIRVAEDIPTSWTLRVEW